MLRKNFALPYHIAVKAAEKFTSNSQIPAYIIATLQSTPEYADLFVFQNKNTTLLLLPGIPKTTLDEVLTRIKNSGTPRAEGDAKHLEKMFTEYLIKQKNRDIEIIAQVQEPVSSIIEDLNKFIALNGSSKNAGVQKRITKAQEAITLLNGDTFDDQKKGIKALGRILPFYTYGVEKNIKPLSALRDIVAKKDPELAAMIDRTIAAYYRNSLRKVMRLLDKIETSCGTAMKKDYTQKAEAYREAIKLLMKDISDQNIATDTPSVSQYAAQVLMLIKSVDFNFVFEKTDELKTVLQKTTSIINAVLSSDQEKLPEIATAKTPSPIESVVKFLTKALPLAKQQPARISVQQNKKGKNQIWINGRKITKLRFFIWRLKDYENVAVNLNIDLNKHSGTLFPTIFALPENKKEKEVLTSFVLMQEG